MMTSLASIRNKSCTATPGPFFSSGQLWKNFRIDFHHYPPTHLHSSAPDEHVLIFNLGGPLTFAWKAEGQWKNGICHSGNIVGLLSPGTDEEVLSEQDYYGLTLSFKAAFADGLTGTGSSRFRIPHNLDDPLLKQIARALSEDISSGRIAHKMYAESLLVACVVHLASSYGFHGRKIFAPKGKLSSGQLKQVIDHVRASIHYTLTMAQLASCVHLSPFHFSRLFRQTVGVSPYQFVLQMKIELAQKLIRENSGSLSDVAYALNFTDQAHFSNAFKKITGVCPRQFMTKPLDVLHP
jgi:AraC family transcriptional regulator